MSELRNGWEIVKLPDVCELNPGKPRASTIKSDTQVTFVPMAAVDAASGRIKTPIIRPYVEVSKGFTAFQDNDVIFAKITPCMENGKAAIAQGLENGIAFGSTEFHVLRPNQAILPEYLFYYIRQDSFRKNAEANMTGSVGQKRVPVDFLKDTFLPLPPLSEQRRIVATLEKLLSRVDAVQARLAKIPLILKRFRQSVLAAACSGRLTADWRNEHPYPSSDNSNGNSEAELPDSWSFRTFSSVSREITVGYVGPMRKEYVESGVPFLRSLNVRPFRFDPSNIKFISPDFHRNIRKSRLTPGDVAIVRSGNSGIACVIPDSLKEANCSDLVILRPSNELDAAYACMFMNSVSAQAHVNSVKVGIAQGHFNVGSMKTTIVPLPPLAEQQEIVRRVEVLFKTADAIEARYRTAIAHVDKLTQSILALAFRGELVPQNPKDEPATLLLENTKRILNSRKNSQPFRKKSARTILGGPTKC